MDHEVRLSAIIESLDSEEDIAADLAVIGDNAGLLTTPDRCPKCGRPIILVEVYAISDGRLTVRVRGPYPADSWTTVPGRHAWTVQLHRCDGTLP